MGLISYCLKEEKNLDIKGVVDCRSLKIIIKHLLYSKGCSEI